MSRRACATLSLPLSQEDWREAVSSFVGGEEGDVLAIEVSIVTEGVRCIASESWTNDASDARQIGESIARWIELRCEVRSTSDLEAIISIWDESASNVLNKLTRKMAGIADERETHTTSRRIKAMLRPLEYALRFLRRLLSGARGDALARS